MRRHGSNTITCDELHDTLQDMGRDRYPWMGEAVDFLSAPNVKPGLGGRGFVRMVQRLDQTLPIDVAWCGLFVGHCLQEAFPEPELPTLWMRSRPYLGYGEEAAPQFGAIMVFWLWARWTPFGHVAFYWAEDDESYHVLGGNQHDRIEIERYPKERLLGTRWPRQAGSPPGERRRGPPGEARPFEHADDLG